ncbi:MAG: protein translocase subunit SecD [Pelagibacterales bacterium]|nr:protein translocase subunit SecD [Pelagibacterales bacterium]
MSAYPTWKYILVITVLVTSFVYSLPNFYNSYPAIEIKSNIDILNENNVSKYLEIIKIKNIKTQRDFIKNDKLFLLFDDTEEQLKAYTEFNASNNNASYTLSSFSDTPKWMESIGAYPMFLGLDLKGGVHFLLQVDHENIITNMLREIQSDVKKILIKNKYRYNLIYQSEDKITVEFDDNKPIDEIIVAVNENLSDLVINKKTIDNKVNLLISPSKNLIDLDVKSALAKNLTILRSRVDELGVAQPILQKQGKDRIIVQLPGLQDSTRAKSILGSTATLEFRLTKGTPQDWFDSKLSGRSTINSATLYQQRGGDPVLLSRKVIVAGDDIKDANTGFDSTSNTPAVFVNLSDYGASKMLDVTSRNTGNKMAVIFVEQNKKEVINVATIREAFGKRFQITGLNLDEAKDLAILLRSGALSAPMQIIEERTVGPSLGEYNILAGKNSMYFGLFLVGLFMFFYYRLFGLIANIALVANIVIIIAVLSLFQATLTLSGIAGIVLTVGMAVDSNVLIFERIREEMLNGNSPNASIYSGYQKAFSTISDANITTLIAAIALLTIGTGAVKGFAVTLVIGILSSMFTSIVGTRALVSIIYERKETKKISI